MIQKFILKTSLFTLPFLLSYALVYFLGSVDKGDLLRIGFLFDRTGDYRSIFKDHFSKPENFQNLTTTSSGDQYDLLTIGDSFSQTQGNYGYQNYIAHDNDLRVLNYDYLHAGMNPLNTVYRIINGDFLSKINVKYILLQSVERSFVERLELLNREDKLLFSKLKNEIAHQKPKAKKPELTSKATLALFFNLLHSFTMNSPFSEVRKVKLNDQLFSTGNKDLLYFTDDLKKLPINNTLPKVELLNEELNKISALLKRKGVQLIVLPCPDKYSIYHPHFKNKENHLAPKFLKHMSTLEKNYLYIDSKQILEEAIKKQKDIYFWDDTHWSPIASQLIGQEIRKTILKASK